MKKLTLAAIVAAVGIAGGTVAISQLDSATRSNLSSRLQNVAMPFRFKSVDLGKRVSKTELDTALSSAAKELGYDINFNDVYRDGYQLGSVREIRNYSKTEVSLAKGLKGLSIDYYGSGLIFYIEPRGFVSEEEIQQYLNAVSKHLPEQ